MGLHRYFIFIVLGLLLGHAKQYKCFAQNRPASNGTQELWQRLNHAEMEYAGLRGRLNIFESRASQHWLDRSFGWIAEYISDSRDSLTWMRRDLAPVPALLLQARARIQNMQLAQALTSLNQLDYRIDQATNEWNQAQTRGVAGAQGITLSAFSALGVCGAATAPSIVGAAGLTQLSPVVGAIVVSTGIHGAGATAMSLQEPPEPAQPRSELTRPINMATTSADSPTVTNQITPVDISGQSPLTTPGQSPSQIPSRNQARPPANQAPLARQQATAGSVARSTQSQQQQTAGTPADVTEEQIVEPPAIQLERQRREQRWLAALRTPPEHTRPTPPPRPYRPARGLRTVAQLVAQAQQGLRAWHSTGHAPFDWVTFELEREAVQSAHTPSQDDYRRALRHWHRSVERYRRIAGHSTSRENGLRSIVNAVIEEYIGNYTRGQPDVLAALLGQGTNCAGETQLLLAAITQSGIQMPAGQELAAQNFRDHIQLVTYNRSTGVARNLLDGLVQSQIVADVYEPAMLLSGAVQSLGATPLLSFDQLRIARHDPQVGLRPAPDRPEYPSLPGSVGLTFPGADVVFTNDEIPAHTTISRRSTDDYYAYTQDDRTAPEMPAPLSEAEMLVVAQSAGIPDGQRQALYTRLRAINAATTPGQRRSLANPLATELEQHYLNNRLRPLERFIRDPALLMQIPPQDVQRIAEDLNDFSPTGNCYSIRSIESSLTNCADDPVITRAENLLTALRQRVYDNPAAIATMLPRLAAPLAHSFSQLIRRGDIPFRGPPSTSPYIFRRTSYSYPNNRKPSLAPVF